MRDNCEMGRILGETTEGYTLSAGSLAPGVLLLCDHASNVIPDGYQGLGLPASELQRHIAYDIGAAGVTLGLARRLGVPAIMTRVSRLLIDCNRGLDDPTLVMRLSDGAIIPGNHRLTEDDRQTRISRYYNPYHAAIDRLIDQSLAEGVVPLLVSMHSFTDIWRGTPRRWHAGVLWDKDPRLAHPVLEHLRADPALVVGDNEPYTGKLRGDCLFRHGTERGLAHVLIEIRQDLIASDAGQAAWADRLAGIFEAILAEARPGTDFRRKIHYGTNAA